MSAAAIAPLPATAVLGRVDRERWSHIVEPQWWDELDDALTPYELTDSMEVAVLGAFLEYRLFRRVYRDGRPPKATAQIHGRGKPPDPARAVLEWTLCVSLKALSGVPLTYSGAERGFLPRLLKAVLAWVDRCEGRAPRVRRYTKHRIKRMLRLYQSDELITAWHVEFDHVRLADRRRSAELDPPGRLVSPRRVSSLWHSERSSARTRSSR